MAVIVTVYPEGPGFRTFEAEGLNIAPQLVDYLEDRLPDEFDVMFVHTTDVNTVTFTVATEADLPKEWYVRVIDVIKNAFNGEHEVQSRLSTWP